MAGTIQVVRLAHSDAVQLAEILKNLIADKSPKDSASQAIATSIQADESLNALVIRADPATMAELKEIIARLDIRRLQVLIEAAIVEVTSDFTRTLGTETGDWRCFWQRFARRCDRSIRHVGKRPGKPCRG